MRAVPLADLRLVHPQLLVMVVDESQWDDQRRDRERDNREQVAPQSSPHVLSVRLASGKSKAREMNPYSPCSFVAAHGARRESLPQRVLA